MTDYSSIFSSDTVQALFPPERTNAFFEALFGDASEGAYDIALSFSGFDEERRQLEFHLNLRQRPGCCLACNLTYGLPDVFSRHPVINIKGLVEDIQTRLGNGLVCEGWRLDPTVQQNDALHVIPLRITLREQE
ncbi:MAG: pancreas/duodenum homeobox protein 1 [Desulfobulbus propionicus]|nr:MAG: pancreas/duodenum homeobox protein 1 [Desulfobulbus propionicus]